MLVLPIFAAGERYGIPCIDVVEVLPAIPLRRIPHAPRFVAGLFSYRGVVTGVVDLSVLLNGPEVEARLSTRLVVASCSAGNIGLLAENVQAPSELELGLTGSATLKISDAPYLGDVVSVDGEMLQIVYIEELVSPALRALFFNGPG